MLKAYIMATTEHLEKVRSPLERVAYLEDERTRADLALIDIEKHGATILSMLSPDELRALCSWLSKTLAMARSEAAGAEA